MKFLMTIFSGVIVGAFGVYFTIDWQEEKLKYAVSAPAKFGDINYQNIIISNDGWNPAVNVKMYVEHDDVTLDRAQSSTTFEPLLDERNGIAQLGRVRRGESVVFAFAYTGKPFSGSDVKIVSDRSIASLIELDAETELPFWASTLLWILGSFFIIGILSSITLPAYQDYVKRAQAANKAANRT